MPTYRYRCDRCGDQIEAWQSIHDDPLRTHDDCGGDLRKVLGIGGIVLKGSGFYRTDNRSSSARDSESKPADKTPTEKTSSNGSGSKSEKSERKAETSSSTSRREKSSDS